MAYVYFGMLIEFKNKWKFCEFSDFENKLFGTV